MGQVPKKKEASCRAWMQGKILTALLIERLLCEARFFSHGVTLFEEQGQWSVFKEFRDALLVQLAMPRPRFIRRSRLNQNAFAATLVTSVLPVSAQNGRSGRRRRPDDHTGQSIASGSAR
jgi:hypothetical protein